MHARLLRTTYTYTYILYVTTGALYQIASRLPAPALKDGAFRVFPVGVLSCKLEHLVEALESEAPITAHRAIPRTSTHLLPDAPGSGAWGASSLCILEQRRIAHCARAASRQAS